MPRLPRSVSCYLRNWRLLTSEWISRTGSRRFLQSLEAAQIGYPLGQLSYTIPIFRWIPYTSTVLTASRHGWTSLENYSSAHDRNLERFPHLIETNELNWDIGCARVKLTGLLHCYGGLEIHVEKELETDFRRGRRLVRTYRYRYHVLRRDGDDVDNIFRFDNSHQYTRHPDNHHFHALSGMDESGKVAHVGSEGGPPSPRSWNEWSTSSCTVSQKIERYTSARQPLSP